MRRRHRQQTKHSKIHSILNDHILIDIAAYPDVEIHDIDENWEFVLLASDGIWDVLSNDDVVRLCLRKIANGTPPEQICEELMTECLSPDLLMTGTDNMTVVLICFLHNKPYEELCKRAKELHKRYSVDDGAVEKNDGSDSFQKCEQNSRVDAAVEAAGGGGGDGDGGGSSDRSNVNATDDDKDISKLNGDVANDVRGDIERLPSDETIPSTDGGPLNASETAASTEDENTEKGEAGGEDGANDDPKIIQESKKFKETDSEDELK